MLYVKRLDVKPLDKKISFVDQTKVERDELKPGESLYVVFDESKLEGHEYTTATETIEALYAIAAKGQKKIRVNLATSLPYKTNDMHEELVSLLRN